MYQYFHGLVIREGTTGVPANEVKCLFEEVGWVRDVPEWQLEKFSLIMENATWAFTVWDQQRMVGMVRIISDKMMMATISDLIVSEDYRGRGIAKKLIELSMAKLPHGDWFAHTSRDVFPFYEKCGLQLLDGKTQGTLAYYGYREAKKQGHR